MKVDNKNYIKVFSEIGLIMYEHDTDTVELNLSTPYGTVIFEVTMRIKEDEEEEEE